MRSIVFIMILSALVFVSPVFAANGTDFPVLDKQVEIRQAHLRWLAGIHETGMEATIDYVGELNNSDTTELERLLGDFRARVASIDGFTTHAAFNPAIVQLISITTDFRLEARRQVTDNNGRLITAGLRILARLADKKTDLDALKDAYWNTRKTNALDIFDTQVSRAQSVLDTLTSRGFDISSQQAKLDEISAKRSDLGAALDDRDNIEIVQVYVDVLRLSRELGRSVKDMQLTESGNITKTEVVRFWAGVGERAVVRAGQIISELESLNLDVAGMQTVLARAQSNLDEANAALDSGDVETAAAALRRLHTDIIELEQEYRNMIFSGILPDDVEKKVESFADSLGNTAGDMNVEL